MGKVLGTTVKALLLEPSIRGCGRKRSIRVRIEFSQVRGDSPDHDTSLICCVAGNKKKEEDAWNTVHPTSAGILCDRFVEFLSHQLCTGSEGVISDFVRGCDFRDPAIALCLSHVEKGGKLLVWNVPVANVVNDR